MVELSLKRTFGARNARPGMVNFYLIVSLRCRGEHLDRAAIFPMRSDYRHAPTDAAIGTGFVLFGD